MGQILECAFSIEGERRRFLFDGDVEISDEISFYCLEIKEVKAETIVPFEIIAKTWAGQLLTPYDAIGDVLSRYTRGATNFQLISMYEPLKVYLDELKKDCIIAGDLEFPKKIIHGSLFDEYNLMYATDQYVYYNEEDEPYLMLSTDNRELIATGFFTQCGYLDSVENVTSGKEVLLYCAENISEDSDQIDLET